MTLYDKVKEIANDRGMSIAALEVKAGIANGTIAGWRAEKSGPFAETLKKVADALEVPMEDLL